MWGDWQCWSNQKWTSDRNLWNWGRNGLLWQRWGVSMCRLQIVWLDPFWLVHFQWWDQGILWRGCRRHILKVWQKDHVHEGIGGCGVFIHDGVWGYQWYGVLGHPCRFWASVPQSCQQKYDSWRLEKCWEHCRIQRTWRLVQKVQEGWWTQPSIGLLTNMDVVVTPANVKFSKVGGILHVINKFRDKR